ncbi:hypothetical protein HYFRA_00009226 [Hymenoscyphus fraxineus]|uniref:Uncharacterized protein n=1 Tax=Hymenoscyphus fraxineus TaxID=746836 RepID=A0A9N9KY48_9HELO|nr:hypothetical protein HYFRA_00009226 [Hymenoscyphus fraxineus]
MSNIVKVTKLGNLHQKRKGRAWYHWYSAEDSPEERKLLLKLDLLIIPYAIAAYWIKGVDQTNISNAYVSGLKDDLGFAGDELVRLNSMYIAGAVIGQLPFTLLFPMFPMNWIIPGMEVGWGLFTLLQYRVESFAELAAYRFMVGFFEVRIMYLALGTEVMNWDVEEGYSSWGFCLERLLQACFKVQHLKILTGSGEWLGGGKLFPYLLAETPSLNWNSYRWMFIICALITIPIAIAGVLIWPGTPARPNRLVLSETEISQAKARLAANKSDIYEKPRETRYQLVKRIVMDRKLWILTLWNTLYWNASTTFYRPDLLWLKSLKRFSTPRVNQLGAIAPSLGMAYCLFVNFSMDLLWGPSGAITFALSWNTIAMIILAIWEVPESAKWFAFLSIYTHSAMSSVLNGWTNDILRDDAVGRGFILTFMNLFSQSSTAWTGLLAFPTSEAPRFLTGYIYAAVMSVLVVIFTFAVILPLSKGVDRSLVVESEVEVIVESKSSSNEKGS